MLTLLAMYDLVVHQYPSLRCMKQQQQLASLQQHAEQPYYTVKQQRLSGCVASKPIEDEKLA